MPNRFGVNRFCTVSCAVTLNMGSYSACRNPAPFPLPAGLIAGAYDIASVLCSIPVSYLGSRIGSSKPRWLGWGVFIMGIGSFVFTLPHFGSPAYDPSVSTSSLLVCLREVRRFLCWFLEGMCMMSLPPNLGIVIIRYLLNYSSIS